jgi:hypothetical protein
MGAVLVAHLLAIASLVAGHVSGEAARAAPPVGGLQAAHVVAQDFGEGVTCKREGPATSRRFFCLLPSLEGQLEVRLSPDARSYDLTPRQVHRTVATESPAELKAARLVPRWDIGHVVCAQEMGRRFTCDGIWKEPRFRAGIEFGLERTKAGHYFLVPCRITWLGKEWGAFLACQHLAWNVNFPQGELEGMEAEQARVG